MQQHNNTIQSSEQLGRVAGRVFRRVLRSAALPVLAVWLASVRTCREDDRAFVRGVLAELGVGRV